jgi:DNA-directed RNA polymerase specialized sigma54-like protein
MAYSEEELQQEVLRAIEDNELVFFNEIEHYISACKSTLEKRDFHKMGIIKDALAKNRVSTKKELRNKWKDGDNATTQIALYKLLSDEKEFSLLCGQQIDHTSKGNAVTGFEIVAPDED